jgi:hypothetical protein
MADGATPTLNSDAISSSAIRVKFVAEPSVHSAECDRVFMVSGVVAPSVHSAECDRVFMVSGVVASSVWR